MMHFKMLGIEGSGIVPSFPKDMQMSWGFWSAWMGPVFLSFPGSWAGAEPPSGVPEVTQPPDSQLVAQRWWWPALPCLGLAPHSGWKHEKL